MYLSFSLDGVSAGLVGTITTEVVEISVEVIIDDVGESDIMTGDETVGEIVINVGLGAVTFAVGLSVVGRISTVDVGEIMNKDGDTKLTFDAVTKTDDDPADIGGPPCTQ